MSSQKALMNIKRDAKHTTTLSQAAKRKDAHPTDRQAATAATSRPVLAGRYGPASLPSRTVAMRQWAFEATTPRVERDVDRRESEATTRI